MQKHLGVILIASILLAGAVYGQSRLGLFGKPCSRPIAYSLGTFDDRFGVSKEEFLSDINDAVNVWEDPTSMDLFKYDPKGNLKINLIYDYRQEATDKLESLGYTIDNNQSSYEGLKSRYNLSLQEYNRLKQNIESEIATYNTAKESYEEQVRKWNSQGGAPKNVVNQLNAQREALNTQAQKINRDQATLNSLAVEINSMVEALNQLAANLNLSVTRYNTIGASRGEEFEEGVYVSTGRSEEINIYEFDSKEKLIRLLTHELGHAIGLGHIESDEAAIMYRLNQDSNTVATLADLAALRELCGL